MDLPEIFKHFLQSREKPASQLTIKNYVADINQFVRWYENFYHTSFHPSLFTPEVISAYKKARSGDTSGAITNRSLERHLSSLRRFSGFLLEKKYISISPFAAHLVPVANTDPWLLTPFRQALFNAKSSDLTIKNYINDIKQFTEWSARLASLAESRRAKAYTQTDDIFSLINSEALKNYREYLSGSQLSPLSINRKLSSLRRYVAFVQQKGLLKEEALVSNTNPISSHHSTKSTANLTSTASSEAPSLPLKPGSVISSSHPALDAGSSLSVPDGSSHPVIPEGISLSGIQKKEPSEAGHKLYSKFPPLRLAQKVGTLFTLVFDLTLVAAAAVVLEKLHYLSWVATGKQIFTMSAKNALGLGNKLSSFIPSMHGSQSGNAKVHSTPFGLAENLIGANIKKESYAPDKISLSGMPFHHRVWHHMRHTRPDWYRKYHSYPVVHYFHFAALIILMSSLGFGLYQSIFDQAQQNKTLAAAPTAPPRILSFQGRLTDNNDNPITSVKDLRFAIYNDVSASGAALLWQETQVVGPDQDGIFSVLLGKSTSIPASVFNDNSTLYLGITVQSDPELAPRQQIATVAFAANSETLQGLYPITAGGAGTTNVVLALDSGGNLTIGGSANPIFSATGGSFTLSGKTLNLNTTAGSNGNVSISPDGTGLILLNSPIQNAAASNNNIPTAKGAVEIDDLFAVLATSSGQSAVTINQNSTGPLISASTSGVAKFTIDSAGAGTFASDVAINGGNLTTTQTALTININGASAGNLKLADTDTFAVGGHVGAAYNAISNSGGTPTNPGVTSDNDLYVQGDLDIGGTLYLAGVQLSPGALTNYWQRNLGALSPTNITDDLLLGGTATSSAVIKLPGLTNKDAFFNLGTGNVGIGTTIPQGKLQVSGSTTLAQGQALVQFNQTSTADIFTASVSGATKFVINNNGNVGIGSAAPAAKLDVVGTISQITGQVTFGGNVDATSGLDVTGANLTVGGANFSVAQSSGDITTAGDFAVNGGDITSSGSTLTININGGSAGILKLGDTDTFAVGGHAGAAYNAISNSGGTPNGSAGITDDNDLYIQGNTDIGGTLYVGGFQVLTGGGYWQRVLGALSPVNITDDLLLGGTATSSAIVKLPGLVNNNALFNLGTGNVGIGSTTPGAKLDVVGNTNLQGYATVSASLAVGYSSVTTGVGNAAFAGNVGIGTSTAPAQPLEVAGANPIIRLNDLAGASQIDWEFGDGVNGVSNKFSLRDVTNNTMIFTAVNTTGNLGIGSVSPTARLDVAGNTNIQGYATASASLAVGYSSVLAGTGNGVFSGNVGIGTTNPASFRLQVAGNVGPQTTNTYDLGSASLQWNNIYGNNFYQNGVLINLTNLWQRVAGALSPANITDDLLLGATATASAKVRLGATTNADSFFNSGGNVGIGTTAPDRQLVSYFSNGNTATGQFNIRQDSTGDALMNYSLGASGVSFALGVDNSDSDKFKIGYSASGPSGVDAGTRLTIDTAGNIGIATDTPSSFKLQVAGNVGPNVDNTYDLGSSSKRWRDLYLGPASLHLGTDLNESIIGYNITDNYIQLDSDGNGTPETVFTDAGNIGVGTTNPSSFKLQVAGNIGPDATNSYDLGSASKQWSNIYAQNFYQNGTLVNLTNYWQRLAGAVSPANITDDLLLGATATASAKIRLGATTNADSFFNSGGNVGIGTTSPLAKIDILTGGAGRIIGDDFVGGDFSGLSFNGGTTANDYNILSSAGSDKNLYLNRPSGSQIQFVEANGTSQLAIASGGNIGIGTTNPAAFKLQVAGNVGPQTTNTYDLGSASLQWNNIYGQNFYQNGTLVNLSNYWQRVAGALSPANITDDLLLGATATSSAIVKLPGLVNKDALFNLGTGNIGIGSTTPTVKLDVVGGINATGRIQSNGVILNAGGGGEGAIYSVNNANLNFMDYTNTNVLASIQQNGNVGIGSTAPLGKFNVDGAATGKALAIFNQNGGNQAVLTASVSGSTKFIVDNAGNVGIGTTNPTRALYVNGDGQFGTGVILSSSGTVSTVTGLANSSTGNNALVRTATTGISIERNIADANAALKVKQVNASSTGDILQLQNNAGTLAVFSQAGNLGIGTTNPSSFMLQVAGNVGPQTTNTYDLGSASLQWNNIYGNNFYQNGTLVNLSNYWQRVAGALSPANITDDLLLGGTATSSAKIRLGATTNANSFFNSGGNVGIGTTNPSLAKLQVSGDIAFPGGNFIISASDTGNKLSLHDGATGRASIFTNSTERLTITYDGTVGIGSTAPLGLFNVDGRATGKALAIFNQNGGNQAVLTASISGVTKFLVDSTGNVGIGTSVPQTLLNLASTGTIRVGKQASTESETSITQSDIINTYNITDSRFGLFSNGTAQLSLPSGHDGGALRLGTGGNYSAISGGGSGNSQLSFYTGGDFTNARLFLDAGGNIGIGTTNPASFKLQVAGNVGPQTTNTYDLGSASLQWNNIYGNNFYQNGVLANLTNYWQRNAGAVSPANITDDLLLGATATASAKVRLGATTNANSFFNSGGNVGIGSTAPAQKLDLQDGSFSVHTSANSFSSIAISSTINSDIFGYTLSNSGTGGRDWRMEQGRSAAGEFNISDCSAGCAQRIVINSSGNVGIGSTAPAALLDISTSGDGVIRSRSTATAQYSGLATYDSGGNLSGSFNYGNSTAGTFPSTLFIGTRKANEPLVFITGGTNERLRIDGNGNIGIGTTNPASFKLQVAGNVGPQTTNTYDLGSASLQWNNIYGQNIYQNGTLLANYWQRNAGAVSPANITDDLLLGATATASAKVKLGATTNANSFFNSGGNVGIGTTNPIAMLHVTGNAILNNITFSDSGGGNSQILGNGFLTFAPTTALTINNAAGGTSVFYADTVATTKGVGLGTTAPLTTLHVDGQSSRGRAALIVDQTASSNNDILTASASGTTRFVIKNNGNVGIGSTAPNQKLDVTGSGLFSGNVGIGTTNISPANLVNTGTSLFKNTISVGNATSGVDRVQITAGGGTAAISETYDVESFSRWTIGRDTYAGGTAGLIMGTSGTYSGVGSSNGSALLFATNGSLGSLSSSERMRIDSAGNIGIGTTNPASFKLQVAGNVGPQTTNTYDLGSASLQWNNIYGNNFYQNGTLVNLSNYWQRNAGAVSPANITDDLLLGATATSSAIVKLPGLVNKDALFNLGTGNVGIGTTTPGAKLDVNGTVTAAGLVTANAGLTDIGTTLINNSGSANTTIGNSSGGTITIGASSGSDLALNDAQWSVSGAGAAIFASINNTPIGAGTPSTGAFTTLTSSGATTLGTGSSLTNTFGSGASSVNTIGSVTTPGALTLHGATTLDNTFTVSGSNLTSLGGNLTVTGTAWTATPTISGLITATSGLTSTGTLTANGTLDANGLFTLGDGGDTGAIDTSDWDISTTGSLTGISGIANDGVYTQTGASQNTFTGNVDATSGLDVTGANLTVGGANFSVTTGGALTLAGQLTSSVTTGTAPLVIASTTKVTNLNADLLDGFNSTDFCQSTGTNCPAASVSFTGITSGTNTTAAMVVGSGASLTYTGTGTINASSLNSLTSSQFLRSDTSTTYTSGTLTLNSGTTLTINGTLGANGVIALGDGGDNFSINSNALDISTGGAITGATGITSSGTINFSGLTASRAIFTDASKNLVSTGASIDLLNSLSDETGSGLAVFGTSPAITTSLTTGSSSFDLLNTTATSINFAGGATGTLAIGNTSGTTNLLGANVRLGSSTTGINITSAGVITDIDGNVTIQDHLMPQATNTYDLGSASLQWNNIYGQNFYQNGTLINLTNYWQRVSGALSPANITDDLLLGATATASAKIRLGGTTNADSFFNTGGNVGIGTTAPAAKFQVLDSNANFNVGFANGLRMMTTGNAAWSNLGTNSSGIPILEWYDSSNAALGVITGTGNVGIGTTTTTQRLTVVSPGSSTDAGAIAGFTSGSATAGNLYGIIIDKSATQSLFLGINKNTTTGSVPANSAYISTYNSTGTISLGRGSGTGTINTADLFISSNGNIGVGTTTPGKTLSVNGTSEATQFYDYDNNRYFIDLASTGTSASAAGNLVFAASSTTVNKIDVLDGSALTFRTSPGGDAGVAERLRITNNGNVGIGTSTPGKKLDVNGDIQITNSGTSTLYFNSGNSSGNVWSYLVGGDQFLIQRNGADRLVFNSAGDMVVKGNINNNVVSAAMTLGASGASSTLSLLAGGSTSRIMIASNGNVGIGTTTPNFSLDVVGSNNTTARIFSTSGTAFDPTDAAIDTQPGLIFHSAQVTGVNVVSSIIANGNTTGNFGSSLAFFTKNTTGDPVEAMRIDKTGNIGIGTTDPGRSLEIARSNSGTTTGLFNLRQDSTGDTSMNFSLGASGVSYAMGIDNSDADKFKIGYSASGGSSVDNGARFTIDIAGNVGIGTEAPGAKLDVQGVVQLNSGATATLFGLCHSGADSDTTFVDREIVACSGIQSGVNDYAEAYPTDDDVTFGDLVAFSDTIVEVKGFNPDGTANNNVRVKINKLTKATAANRNRVIGVISNNYTDFQSIGHAVLSSDQHPLPLALNGRVPVKVSTENGPINTGDRLTASSKPGVSMKATTPGQVVGYALAPYTNSDPTAVGEVIVFSGASFFDPTIQIAQSGNLNVTGSDEQSFEAWAGQYKFENKGGFAEAVIARLTAGIVKTQQLVVSGTSTFLGTIQAQTINASSIAVNTLSIGGQSLHDYIIAVVQNAGFTNTNSINSPVANIDQLNTNIISPLGGAEVKVTGDLTIKKTTATNGNLTVEGNASVSGTLAGKDASFSGTLRADRIIANDIEGLNARIASIAASTLTASSAAITNIYNTYNNASNSAISSASGSGSLAQAELPYNFTTGSLYSGVANIGSLSANLAYVPGLSAETATINQGLMVFGSTSLSDTSVTSQLSVDGSLIIANNSINVLGSTFDIQPLRQGNISFEGGLVGIDTDGNLTVGGNAYFAKDVAVNGTLSARIVSPVPSSDLIIQLPGSEADQGTLAVDRPGVVVKNSSGSAVLKITDVGDVIASGAALASQFQVVRGVSADTSATQSVATASAGVATIKQGQFERTIISPYVTEKSLIYITATTDTNGITPFVARQVAQDPQAHTQGSFTIRIPVLQSKDIKINWWIVN